MARPRQAQRRKRWPPASRQTPHSSYGGLGTRLRFIFLFSFLFLFSFSLLHTKIQGKAVNRKSDSLHHLKKILKRQTFHNYSDWNFTFEACGDWVLQICDRNTSTSVKVRLKRPFATGHGLGRVGQGWDDRCCRQRSLQGER